MAAVQFENFFFTELSAPVAPGDTSIQITQDGLLGTLLTGGNWIYLNLIDATSWNNNAIPPATYEIVKATAITGTGPFTVTVTRAQDHTTAQSFSRCDICAFLLNAQSLYDLVTGGGGSGTVTLINTTLPITGGPISTTGTVGINTMTGDSGSGGARGAVPAPSAGDAAAGKFLKADATWAVPPGGGGAVSSVSSTDHILTFSPTTGAVVGSLATTTKGDLIVRSASNNERLGVGSNNQVLTADSTQTLGVKWASVPSAGSLQSQEFTTSGTWTRPTGVTGVWITMIGGGGGGSTTITAALGGGGGGSGELVQNMQVNVSGDVSVTVGSGGSGGASGQASAQAGSDGGDSSFGSSYIARGGKGATTAGVGGAGGGIGGATGGGVGVPGATGVLGAGEAPTYYGGNSGGGGGNSTSANGGTGSGAPGYPSGSAGGAAASSQAGGGGGANTIYGLGAAGGAGGAIGNNASATSYGAGGGGGGGKATTTIGGGSGSAGYVLVVWVA